MYAISLTGGPRKPSIIMFVLVIMVAASFLAGCADRQYISVPECEVTSPPDPEHYVNASPDEQTVMMTDAYIKQVKAVKNCNIDIGLVNTRNQASESK